MANYKAREDIVLAHVILLFHRQDETNAFKIESHLRGLEFPRVGKVRVAMVEEPSLPENLEDVLQSVDRGAVIMALFTPRFTAKNLSTVYKLFYYTIKKNPMCFVPVYLEQFKWTKFVPHQFSLHKGIWWNRDGQALLCKTLEHHITQKYPFSDI